MNILLAIHNAVNKRILSKYISEVLNHTIYESDDFDSISSTVSNNNIDVIIYDTAFSIDDPLSLVSLLNHYQSHLGIEVIVLSDTPDAELAIEAFRRGAFDFIVSPIDSEYIAQCIAKVAEKIAKKNSKNTNSNKVESENKYNFLDNGAYFYLPSGEKIGVFSNKLREVVNTALIFHEDRSIPVLIEGESGTGKEIIASIIHFGNQENETSPLISINCSAISPSLFESELFGYEGHTFTGAKESGMKGKLELANGGTIFLDEIGDMPLEMQPKLLRVLQDKQLYKIGANKPINLDIRIVAATNRNLEEMVEEGRFRSDLYHRLKIGWIRLPSLREQKSSISSIAQMFLVDAAEKRHKQFKYISKEAIKILENNTWKGNIRELKNIIERIVLLYDEIELRPEHLSIATPDADGKAESGRYTLSPGTFDLPDKSLNLRAIELEIVRLALEKFNNNKSKTAQYLGLTLSALRSRLDRE